MEGNDKNRREERRRPGVWFPSTPVETQMKQRDETAGTCAPRNPFMSSVMLFPVALSTNTVTAPFPPKAGETNKCGSRWSRPGSGDSR